jgi:RNA polymerase sigma-70 factor (ECF subfamily)
MLIENLENQTNLLLSAALQKCGNLDEARDLTQDALLAALDYIAKGNKINDMRGWLLTVLNRRFYQKLRKKYQIPTVTIGECFDITDESDCFESVVNIGEAEQVRKAVAYLAGLHREVIVRYYMNGENVQKIAAALGIPEGTVKSRLSAGREQIKKELSNNMENYEKQSYEPIRLRLSHSGHSGMNGEPRSLVDGDLIAQNLLYLAYNKPVTELELSKAIGIPTAYIEPVIKKLIDGELMKRVGNNKVYTDFMITTIKDQAKTPQHISECKKLVEDNQDLFFKALKTGVAELRETEFYARYNEHQKQAIELELATYCFSFGTYNAFNQIYDSGQVFPERPNGGGWITFGDVVITPDLEKELNLEESKYFSYYGQRTTYLENYFDAKSISIGVWDLAGFQIKIYYQGENRITDANLTRLLYIIESGTDTQGTGFNVELLKNIPWLVECGILRYDENSKPKVDIPVLSPKECELYNKIRNKAMSDYINDIKEVFAEFLKDKKQEIPGHLTSVPLQKQYIGPSNLPVMEGIRAALRQGIIKQAYDYDSADGSDDSNDAARRFPYAMIFVIDSDK